MDTFENTAEAFRNARRRAVVAAELQADLLHAAVHDARQAGMTIRQAADDLCVPRRVVARHWGRRAPEHPPSAWGSADEWQAAWAAVWAHDRSKQAQIHVPYDRHDGPDGSQAVTARPRGAARRRPHSDHDGR